MERSVAAPRLQGPLSLRVIAVLGAVAADCALWAVLHLLGGIALQVRMTPGAAPQEVGIASVVVASALVGIGAALLATVLGRCARRPRRAWIVIALVALALSLLGPLGAAEAAPARLALLSIHLAAGAVLISVLWGSLPGFRTGTSRRG